MVLVNSPTKQAYMKAINRLREKHIEQMDLAIEAHKRLRHAETQDWSDSWRYEDDFLKAYAKADGIFNSIKVLEDLIFSLEE